MIWLAILRRAAPFLLLAAAAGAAWWWHARAVSDAYEAGEAAVMGRWQEAERVAVAVGNETTALLKRANARNTGVLDEKLKALDKTAAVRAHGLAAAERDADELYQLLQAARSSAPAAGGADSCPASRIHEAALGECRGLLAQGIRAAAEARRLADDGEAVIAAAEARLSALQGWAALVQATQNEP